MTGYSLLDRTRILKGLMHAADLTAVPADTRQTWMEFVKGNLPGLVRELTASKEEETLEAAANVIEISGRYPAPGTWWASYLGMRKRPENWLTGRDDERAVALVGVAATEGTTRRATPTSRGRLQSRAGS